jgi:hypothetical protein
MDSQEEADYYEGLREQELVPWEEPTLAPTRSFITILAAFLKTLSRHTSDLHKLNCPALLVSGVSLLEYVQHWGDHPELLVDIDAAPGPRERIKAVVRWILSTLHGSFASRTPTDGSYERKPYNPILGEQFYAWWLQHGQRVVVEQVSHHPPVSAFYLANQRAGVHVNGFSGQATNFTGTGIRYRQPGRVFLYLERHDEEYCITLPELEINGLLTGRPFVEITGEIDVTSTTQWAAHLKFNSAGSFIKRWLWRNNLRDTFGGTIFHTGIGVVDWDLWGNWKTRMYCAPFDRTKELIAGAPSTSPENCPTPEHGKVLVSEEIEDYAEREMSKKKVEAEIEEMEEEFIFYDAQANTAVKPMVKPLDRQNDMESRRVWLFTTQALANQDYERAEAMKTAVEEQERSLRRERAARNEQWQPRLFVWMPDLCFLPGRRGEGNDNGGLGEGKPDVDDREEGNEAEESECKHEGGADYTGRWVYRGFHEQHVQPRFE